MHIGTGTAKSLLDRKDISSISFPVLDIYESCNAYPGEILYNIKEFYEQIGVIIKCVRCLTTGA